MTTESVRILRGADAGIDKCESIPGLQHHAFFQSEPLEDTTVEFLVVSVRIGSFQADSVALVGALGTNGVTSRNDFNRALRMGFDLIHYLLHVGDELRTVPIALEALHTEKVMRADEQRFIGLLRHLSWYRKVLWG